MARLCNRCGAFGEFVEMEIVNGFVCRNCADTALARRHIDPAHPKDGPFGANAPPERKDEYGPAVKIGDRLSQITGAKDDDPPRVSGGAHIVDVKI
jgi:hypothetical protein